MSTRGFSTVELMVTLAIVGILAAFAAPNLKRWSNVLSLHSTVRMLASELQVARMKAIAQNTSVEFCVYPPSADFPEPKYSRGYFSTHPSTTDWCRNPPASGAPGFNTFKLTVSPLPLDVQVQSNQPRFVFLSGGRVNVGGTITLTNQGASRTRDIKIDLVGRVRACEHNDPNC